MASVFKRGKTWTYRASYLDEQGVRHQPTKGGYRTKALALAAANELEVSKLKGADLTGATVTLIGYYDQWLKTYKVGKHSQVTESRYPTIRRALVEYFGEDMPLKDITRTSWQSFINAYAAGTITPRNPKKPQPRSRDTVSKLNGYVHSMAESAIADRIIYTNFAAGYVNPGTAPLNQSLKYLEADQFTALLHYCQEHAKLTRMYLYCIATAILTGCRASEIIALQWSDIDFEHHIIHVTKSWDYVYGTGFKPTKTPSGVRDIDVPAELTDMLQRLRTEQSAYYMRTGYRDELDLVFRNNRHDVPGDAALNHGLKRVEVELGFEKPITFHGLRHTHVSYLLSKGVDIAYISHRLGHSDITITLRVYQHLLKSHEVAQAEHTVNVLSALSAQ
ncbi:tyrosine-type recombinase/integrase [Lacticaseibacillus suilingensis]|uniref:Tyrosine-type recombinase/integrase n=1 Tax=Lacticaseibacillus suilingensis TaxID=2799577 RepID=A0ABW4BF37_9LACO|nr:site-specific integrase [Lacticaseibacillus suilingensis]